MASLTKSITQNLFDSVLPTYGNQRKNIPVWDDSQKMFICDEYESASGHRYYKGVRFCDRVAIVEKVGLYHNCTYVDGIEVYAFNGTRLELVQKRDYEKTFREEDFIRRESECLVRDYLMAAMKVQNGNVEKEYAEEEARRIVGDCYRSFLAENYNLQLAKILLRIEQ
ncbi:MAG: hypothetical protein KBS65_00035 [Prevotella sp.]|nr:hypothetical protein [Candidatus Equicola stercoris]